MSRLQFVSFYKLLQISKIFPIYVFLKICISGPTDFKPVLFKDQVYFVLFNSFWNLYSFRNSRKCKLVHRDIDFPGGSVVKNLPAMQELQETQVWSLGWEDPLEKDMVTHSSILAWKIPWTEEPGRLQSVGSQRVRHDWATNTFTNTFTTKYKQICYKKFC